MKKVIESSARIAGLSRLRIERGTSRTESLSANNSEANFDTFHIHHVIIVSMNLSATMQSVYLIKFPLYPVLIPLMAEEVDSLNHRILRQYRA
jgi:5-methylcytosine-specific restriction endonuclease McrBC regulatory subunit McrC